MKKTLSILLAALFIVAAIGSAAAEPVEGEPGSVKLDKNSPYAVEDGVIYVEDEVFAGEIVSCLTDKTGASVRGADGAALAATDTVAGGETLVSGGASANILRLGDANSDGKLNSRDVVGMMLSIVNSTGAGKTADVDGNGKLNALDVTKLMRKIVGWDVIFELPVEKAEDESDALKLYFTSTMLRIEEIDTEIKGPSEGVIYVAKNEIEDAHMMLVSTEAKDGLTLEIGDIKNAAGDVLDREVRYGYYYGIGMMDESFHQSSGSVDWQSIHMGRYADPYPTLNAPFSVGANTSKSFIVKVKTTADTASGWYSAPVVLRDVNGSEIKRTTLHVYVWDFALDVTPACRTLFGMSSPFVAGQCGIYDGGIWDPIYNDDWYGYALENRISSYDLPNGEYTDKAMDDPRVTAFVSAAGKRDGSDFDDPSWVNALKSTYNHLSLKQEWLDKAYIYDVDEPWSASGAQAVKYQWENAKAALGDTPFKIILPLTSNCWISDEGRDMLEASWDYCNAICPQSNCFTISAPKKERIKDRKTYPAWGEYMEDGALAKYGQFRPRYEQLRERGDDMWWYICIGPQAPYANWMIFQQGVVNRTVLWQQYYYDIDGILYWAMNAWTMGEHDSRPINLKRVNNGDGLLLYNGALWGEDTLAVPSIRLEEVRDGIEDFQYLRQLERELGSSGRDAAMEYTTRVTTDILWYSDDWHDIDGARNEMGWELESLNAAH